jgi:CDP-glucose 4,6-dehydratase
MDTFDRAFWSERRVFVTGCTGFLGSWLTDQLLELGATVVGLVRDITPAFAGGPRGVTYVLGALEDQPLLERAINEHEIDVVFHIGAQPIVGTANRDPLSTFEANIRGSYNLLESCRRVGTVQRIVIASSDKAYGAQEKLPYDEAMPLQGSHPYDVTKSCTDLIARTYHHTYGLPVCITRCGNFFGGRDLNFNRIVPGTIRWALNGQRPIIRSDGTFIRDYIYIRDVVSAYIELAQHMENPAIHGEAFNFGLDQRVTVLQLTERILSLMGRTDLVPVVLNEAKGEIRNQYLSSAKARRVLGWRPHWTLDEALAETIDWYRAHSAAVEGVGLPSGVS